MPIVDVPRRVEIDPQQIDTVRAGIKEIYDSQVVPSHIPCGNTNTEAGLKVLPEDL